MLNRMIIVHTSASHVDDVLAVAKRHEIENSEVYSLDGKNDEKVVHLLVQSEREQDVLDELQSVVSRYGNWRITILSVKAAIPRIEKPESEKKNGEWAGIGGESREELYDDVAQNAQLDKNFFLLAALSTVVCAIGLIEGNVAVVIGAMVIAPLLGPILAFALGVALGERRLMLRSTKTSAVGLALTLGLCTVIGLVYPIDTPSVELLALTEVGFGGIVLALASGAAAALSLSAGISTALVGVMVSVALLPPAATVGLMLGTGSAALALGAALLLATNVVCLNLSAQVIFLTKGVTPRIWWEKEKARRASIMNACVWLFLLLALIVLLYLRIPALP